MLGGERRDFRGSFSGYERDRLFYNAGGALVPSAYVFGLDGDHDGRAAAPVDIDGDGDLDLALLTLQGLRLLENTSDEAAPAEARRYARVRLAATRSAAPALGAVVTLEAGGVTRRDYVRITEGFQTQVPLDLHFGLGVADRVERLTVEWPSGAREVRTDLPVDRLLRVEEGRPEVAVGPLARWPDGTRPKPVGAPSTAIEAPRLEGGSGPLAAGGRQRWSISGLPGARRATWSCRSSWRWPDATATRSTSPGSAWSWRIWSRCARRSAISALRIRSFWPLRR